MSLTIHSGLMDIVGPDGTSSDYERWTVTRNIDGSATMRTLTRSPRGDLLRDVNHLDAPDWRPIEAFGRLFSRVGAPARSSAASLAKNCIRGCGTATTTWTTRSSTRRRR